MRDAARRYADELCEAMPREPNPMTVPSRVTTRDSG